jgi:hypothetical protein
MMDWSMFITGALAALPFGYVLGIIIGGKEGSAAGVSKMIPFINEAHDLASKSIDIGNKYAAAYKELADAAIKRVEELEGRKV